MSYTNSKSLMASLQNNEKHLKNLETVIYNSRNNDIPQHMATLSVPLYSANLGEGNPMSKAFFVSCEDIIFNVSDKYKGIDMEKYKFIQSDFLNNSFFNENDSLKWNYYLYLVYKNKDVLKQFPHLEIEQDTDYARKKFIHFDNIKDTYTSAVLTVTDNEFPNPEKEWSTILGKEKLEAFLYSNEYSKTIESYFNGEHYKQYSYTSPNAIETPRKISKISIENYRTPAFTNNETLDFKSFNLIYGANGTGKSSIIDAIEYAATGSIRRLKDLKGKVSGTVEIECVSESSEKLTISSTCSSAEKKERESSWYNTPITRQHPRISDKFEHINRFSIESIFSLLNSQNDMKDIMSQILFGMDVVDFQKNFKEYCSRFSVEEIDSTKLLNEQTQYVKSLVKEKDILLKDSSAQEQELHKIYCKFFDNDDFNFAKMYELYTSCLHKFDILISNPEINNYKGVLQQKNLFEEQKLIKLEHLELGNNKNEKKKVANQLESTLTGLEKRKQNHLELLNNIEALHFKLQKNKIEVKNKSFSSDDLSLIKEKKQDAIVLVNDYPVNSLNLKYALSNDTNYENNIASLKARIESSKAKMQTYNTNTANYNSRKIKIESKMEEMEINRSNFFSLGKKILNATDDSFCPFCGASHSSTEELLKSAISIEKIANNMIHSEYSSIIELIHQETSKKSDLENNIATLEKEYNTLHLIFRSHKDLCIDYENKNFTQIYEEIIYYSEISMKEIHDIESGFDKIKTIFIKMYPGENNLDINNIFNIVNKQIPILNSEVLETNTLIQKLENDLRELNLNIDKLGFDQNSFSILDSKTNSYESLFTLLSSRKLNMNNFDNFEDLYNDLKYIENANALIEKKDSNINLDEKISNCKKNQMELESKIEKCRIALVSLELLKPLNDYSSQFISQNMLQINFIFKKLHLPPEFSKISLNDGEIVLSRNNLSESISMSQLSMGQKTSLALAILFQLHTIQKNAPRFLLLDDPISNLDDIHIMNLIDILKDMVSSGTQVFFTTANNNIAEYIRRKFSFLQDELKVINLFREVDSTKIFPIEFIEKPHNSSILI